MTAVDTATSSEEKRPIDWSIARVAFEERGLSFREIGELVGASHEGIRKRALAEGWARADGAMDARAEERRVRTESATQAARLRWAQRRADEADRAGETAEIARARVVEALDGGDHQMTRAAVGAYMVMIDKAQLLSGGVTSRHDDVPLEDRIDKVLSGRDELASRRRAS